MNLANNKVSTIARYLFPNAQQPVIILFNMIGLIALAIFYVLFHLPSISEETILIFNFFLLMIFFYIALRDLVNDFLNDRRLKIKHEANRVIKLHRHNSIRLKETYQERRSIANSVQTSVVHFYKAYNDYRVNAYPFLFEHYLSSVTASYLHLLYTEELNVLRNIYLQKALQVRVKLAQNLNPQFLVESSVNKAVTLIERS